MTILLIITSISISVIIILLLKIRCLCRTNRIEETNSNKSTTNETFDLKKENHILKEKVTILKKTISLMKKRMYRLATNQIELSNVPLTDKYILYVDYNEERITAAKKVLKQLGVKCDIIKDVKKALNTVKEKNYYDAIIISNISEGIDSETFIARLHKDEDFDTPIIVASGNSNLRNHFLNSVGADEFLKKPLETEDTKRALENVFYYKSIIDKI